ncbi:hypothetical protein DVH24_005575 [Malus domestica]|uniref:Uncharacterized protein n=1 Tax=Malus domestica TaxID=3750 RepID=A0A498IMW3_MALDO|nr:hypothetical protein DVH24_005575 [Malus domestica]
MVLDNDDKPSAVEAYDSYFAQKRGSIGSFWFITSTKGHCCYENLAYGVATDDVDDYVRILETTSIEALERFFFATISIFKSSV